MNCDNGMGQHLIIDFAGARHLTDVDKIEFALKSAAEAAGAVVLDTKVHRFPNSHGVTGIAVLAESHISIHTWPEHGYIALDIFMCGDSDPHLALRWLKDYFRPTSSDTQLLTRRLPLTTAG